LLALLLPSASSFLLASCLSLCPASGLLGGIDVLVSRWNTRDLGSELEDPGKVASNVQPGEQCDERQDVALRSATVTDPLARRRVDRKRVALTSTAGRTGL
jgi:hypothetical protein